MSGPRRKLGAFPSACVGSTHVRRLSRLRPRAPECVRRSPWYTKHRILHTALSRPHRGLTCAQLWRVRATPWRFFRKSFSLPPKRLDKRLWHTRKTAKKPAKKATRKRSHISAHRAPPTPPRRRGKDEGNHTRMKLTPEQQLQALRPPFGCPLFRHLGPKKAAPFRVVVGEGAAFRATFAKHALDGRCAVRLAALPRHKAFLGKPGSDGAK